MPVEVILPKVDMDMATGRITRWFVAEGAEVAKGQALFEIETGKAAMEIEAPASGVLRNVSGEADVDIPVGQAVAWIFEAGEAAGEPAAAAPASALVAAAPIASPPPAKPAAPIVVERPASAPRGKIPASPLARRLAREARLDLAAVTGSGPRGRVVAKDVRAAAGAMQKGPAGAPAATSGPGGDDIRRLFEAGSYEEAPHDGMRRTIARRLVDAKQSIPHIYLTMDCELDALLKLRAELNGAAARKADAPRYRLSVNDMVVKAFALALRDVPDANVSWTDSAMLRHARADIAVAVSVAGGLITPIVRDAGAKSLASISNEMRDLAARAKARQLKAEEYQGGSAAISNLGMFGVKNFAAIVNPPHATILAVGAATQSAVVRDGALAVATLMSATLSADHRAVDGALAAELLAAFRYYVENPIAMLA